MKAPKVILSSLLLLGAGAAICWQFSSKEKPEETTERQSESRSAVRSVRSEDKESRFAKLTDRSIRWEVRADMLRRIDPAALSSQDIDTLYSLLHHKPEVGQEKNWWVVVNEIMEQMRIHGIGAERYTETMLGIVNDSSVDEVIRDYAVQHVGQWVTPRLVKQGRPSESNPALIEQTTQDLSQLITDPALGHSSIPGTTLMVLIDMQEGGVSEQTLAPVIARLEPWFSQTIAGENQVGRTTRISAINAVGMLGLTDQAAVIRELANSEEIDASIRLNSIATLGMIGEDTDLETLSELSATSQTFRYAAKASYKRLQDRMAANSQQ